MNKMVLTIDSIPYPRIRHLQRYEFLVQTGLVNGLKVLDVGCGHAYGSIMLTTYAKTVVGIDPALDTLYSDNAKIEFQTFTGADGSRLKLSPVKLEEVDPTQKFDMCVAMEFLEHVDKPDKALQHMASLAPLGFFSTPMVEKTGKSRNPAHVQEFSNKDFMDLVSREYDIDFMVYQNGMCKMTHTPPAPMGDSFDQFHIVQMAVCRKKGHKC